MKFLQQTTRQVPGNSSDCALNSKALEAVEVLSHQQLHNGSIEAFGPRSIRQTHQRSVRVREVHRQILKHAEITQIPEAKAMTPTADQTECESPVDPFAICNLRVPQFV